MDNKKDIENGDHQVWRHVNHSALTRCQRPSVRMILQQGFRGGNNDFFCGIENGQRAEHEKRSPYNK